MYLLIVVYLDPCRQTQESQDLWLNLQGNVEARYDVIYAERNASPGPKHHHGRLKAGRVVASVIDNDLRDELEDA